LSPEKRIGGRQAADPEEKTPNPAGMLTLKAPLVKRKIVGVEHRLAVDIVQALSQAAPELDFAVLGFEIANLAWASETRSAGA
jgi:hypothetical protein